MVEMSRSLLDRLASLSRKSRCPRKMGCRTGTKTDPDASTSAVRRDVLLREKDGDRLDVIPALRQRREPYQHSEGHGYWLCHDRRVISLEVP
jgi:hypothetical protein